jgi:hypothetical protein
MAIYAFHRLSIQAICWQALIIRERAIRFDEKPASSRSEAIACEGSHNFLIKFSESVGAVSRVKE